MYSVKQCENFLYSVAQSFFDFIESNNSGVITLSGGSTPPKIFDELYKMYEFNSIQNNLEKYKILPTDERNVDATHRDNNSTMLANQLYRDQVPKNFFHFITSERIEDAVALNSEKFKDFSTPILSIIGVGSDGHTASLFPGQFNPKDNGNIVNGGIGPDSHNRISLSHSYLLSSKNLWILCNGKEKFKALKLAENNQESPLYSFLQRDSVVYTTKI